LCRILGDRQVQLTVSGLSGLQGSVQPSLVSTTYGVTIPATKVRIRGNTAIPARITTRISWADVTDMASDQSEFAKEAKIRGAVAEGVCQA
jgi:hypothetical protein